MIGNRLDWRRFAAIAPGLCALAAALLVGCERGVLLRGSVYDVQGQRLPGVAVSVRGTDRQAVTTGIGRYGERRQLIRRSDDGLEFNFGSTSLLRAAPGRIQLDFMKTGYTTAHVMLDVADERWVDVTDVTLYPLPPAKGVYLFERFRYRDLTRIEPRQYRSADGNAKLLGTKLSAEAATTLVGAALIAHRQPTYDVRLCRLVQTEARRIDLEGESRRNAEGAKETVWAPEQVFTVAPMPIDEPEQSLIELRPVEPLAPGVYAVHWGAFDGYRSTDPAAYLFRVVDPAEAAELEAAAAEAAAAEAAATEAAAATLAPGAETPAADAARFTATEPGADAEAPVDSLETTAVPEASGAATPSP